MGKIEKFLVIILIIGAITSFSWTLVRTYQTHTVAIPAEGGEYIEGVLGQPRVINPLLATTATDTALTRLVFASLYTYDNEGRIVPELAESLPGISDDQKNYTINLRRGAKWHNGADITSDDVIFTFQTIQNEQYKSPLRSEWLSSTVEKINDYTIVFKNKDISGPFLDNLTVPILPKTIWSQVPPENFATSEYNLEAIGSGAYTVKAIKKIPGGNIQSITLESFADYYAGTPKIKTVTVRFFDSYEGIITALHGREIHGFGFSSIDKNVRLTTTSERFTKFELPLPQYQAVFFNTATGVLKDKNIRQALALSTDKQALQAAVFEGSGRIMHGPLTPEQVTGDPVETDLGYNPNQAAILLDKAGWPMDEAQNLRLKQGKPLEINLVSSNIAANAESLKFLAESWQKLGVKVNQTILDPAELTDVIIRPRKFDALVLVQRLGADADPFPFWHSSQTKDPGLNITGFKNEATDKLITEARSTTQEPSRQDRYRRFYEIINQEVPAIFLNQNTYVYWLSNDIKNIGLHILYDPAFRMNDISRWYIEEKRILK